MPPTHEAAGSPPTASGGRGALDAGSGDGVRCWWITCRCESNYREHVIKSNTDVFLGRTVELERYVLR